MIGPELESFTYQYIPEAAFERLLRGVFLAHSAALEEGRASYAATELENVLPFNRRAKLEGYMRDAALMYPEVTSEVIKAPGSGWYHTELRNGPIVLTASAVQVPCGPVDPADFRLRLAANTLAADDGQFALWDEAKEDSALIEDSLYVLLLHSRSTWSNNENWAEYGHLPGSAYVAFPSPDLKRYAHTINLFAKFPQVVESLTPQSWDAEARLSYIRRAQDGDLTCG